MKVVNNKHQRDPHFQSTENFGKNTITRMLRQAASVASRARVICTATFEQTVWVQSFSDVTCTSTSTSTRSIASTTMGSASRSLPLFHSQRHNYSSTCPLLKKKKNKNEEDPEIIKLVEEQEAEGIIQSINSDLSQEEMQKMLKEELAQIEADEKEKLYEDWKPGERKRPLVMSYRREDFEEELNPDKSIRKWTLRDKRCGAIGIKVGMMPVWDTWGERHPCTVLFLDANIVMGHKTVENHGYMAVQLAAGERKKKNVGKAIMGQYSHLDELEEHPPYIVREFRVTAEDCIPPIGTQIHARHFVPGQNVDVAGTSKGKGFQGAMKRHNFKGGSATHGNSKSHRALGSTGQCQDPGKVFKGKKMAGRMGNERVTVQNLRVMKVDRGRNLLYLKGAIPGQNGGFVEIRDAVKKPLWGSQKVEDELKLPPLPTFEYEEGIDGAGEKHEQFMPLPLQDPFSPDDQAAA